MELLAGDNLCYGWITVGDFDESRGKGLAGTIARWSDVEMTPLSFKTECVLKRVVVIIFRVFSC